MFLRNWSTLFGTAHRTNETYSQCRARLCRRRIFSMLRSGYPFILFCSVPYIGAVRQNKHVPFLLPADYQLLANLVEHPHRP